ncbi:MAG: N-acetylmuramoyl-L-alanine amidase [Ruminococcus sp.]|nr:N-acetylmuramoyl-L-alanine amidase [Ruminococcus sp.]
MERMSPPPDMSGRKVVYTERQGRIRYTYYDDGLVKITKYKHKSRVRWGRVIVALIFFLLCSYAVAHLIGAVASAISGKKKAASEKEFIFDSSISEAVEVGKEPAVTPETESKAEEVKPEPEKPAEPEVKKLDFKVCLDPGHGDYDVGIMNAQGVTESSQNLEFAMLVKEQLEAMGVSVVMTRTDNVNVSMDERCSLANKTGCDLFISLHMSGSNDPYDGSKGVTVLINNASPAMDSLLASNILDALSKAGISQSNGVQPGFMGMPESNYQINTNTVMPSCQVELGYLTSDEDALLYNEKKLDYAKAVAEAAAKTAKELNVIGDDGKRLLTGQLMSEGKSHIIVNEDTPIGSV